MYQPCLYVSDGEIFFLCNNIFCKKAQVFKPPIMLHLQCIIFGTDQYLDHQNQLPSSTPYNGYNKKTMTYY